jgi:hypothetical protein
MKKITLIILLLVAYASAEAQLYANQGKINLESLELKNENQKIVKIGDSEAMLVAALGNPSNIENYEFKINGTFGKLMKYGVNRLFCEENSFYTWTLRAPNIYVGGGDKYFQVGDTPSKVFEVFPEFQQSTDKGYIEIPLRTEAYDMECTNLLIHISGRLISKILRHDC